jgi:hypothetical protein
MIALTNVIAFVAYFAPFGFFIVCIGGGVRAWMRPSKRTTSPSGSWR